MIAFQTIRARAEKRKGGAEALAAPAAAQARPEGAASLPDDRALARNRQARLLGRLRLERHRSEMAGLRGAFLGFDPARLAFQPDEFWDGLTEDARIVRNGAKIMSVRDNARFVLRHRQGARQLRPVPRDWPPANEVGLLEVLAKRGSRLGGNTGQMLLRFLG